MASLLSYFRQLGKAANKGKGKVKSVHEDGFKVDVAGTAISVFPIDSELSYLPSSYNKARKAYLQRPYSQSYELQTIYNELSLDPHVKACMQARFSEVLSKKFVFKDKNDEEIEGLEFICDESWFQELLALALESIMFGQSLVLFKGIPGDPIKLELVDRRYVIPNTRVYVKTPGATDGPSWDDKPNEMIFFELYKTPYHDGLFASIAPLVLLKQHSFINWRSLITKYGVPSLFFKTRANAKEQIEKLMTILGHLEKNPNAILPKDVEIETSAGKGVSQGQDMFREAIEVVNKEISKCIVGGDMVNEAGASYSQAELHVDQLKRIAHSDVKVLLRCLNKYLLPILRYRKYDIPENAYLAIEESIDVNVRLEQDIKISQMGFQIDPEYIMEQYGVKVIPQGTDNQEDNDSTEDTD